MAANIILILFCWQYLPRTQFVRVMQFKYIQIKKKMKKKKEKVNDVVLLSNHKVDI